MPSCLEAKWNDGLLLADLKFVLVEGLRIDLHVVSWLLSIGNTTFILKKNLSKQKR